MIGTPLGRLHFMIFCQVVLLASWRGQAYACPRPNREPGGGTGGKAGRLPFEWEGCAGGIDWGPTIHCMQKEWPRWLTAPPSPLMTCLAVEDPRSERAQHHELQDILVLGVRATMCGADHRVAREDLGKAH